MREGKREPFALVKSEAGFRLNRPVKTPSVTVASHNPPSTQSESRAVRLLNALLPWIVVALVILGLIKRPGHTRGLGSNGTANPLKDVTLFITNGCTKLGVSVLQTQVRQHWRPGFAAGSWGGGFVRLTLCVEFLTLIDGRVIVRDGFLIVVGGLVTVGVWIGFSGVAFEVGGTVTLLEFATCLPDLGTCRSPRNP